MRTKTPVHRARLERGLTLRDLSALCAEAGVSVTFSQLSKIERGLAVPNPRLRATLAQLLGIDIDDFERKAS